MANPILVEVTRGDLVESVHRGAIAIMDADGTAAPGARRCRDAGLLALVPEADAGHAAGRIRRGGRVRTERRRSRAGLRLALRRADAHRRASRAWLARIGLGESDLACGAHASRYEPVAEAMIRRGEKPTRIFNNCSGKHTGFLTVARHWDIATKGYERPNHPVQRAVADDAERAVRRGVNCRWESTAAQHRTSQRRSTEFARPLREWRHPTRWSNERATACTAHRRAR